MAGEEVSCSHCGALLLIPEEVIFSSLECPCCRAKLIAPRAARKRERKALVWENIFAISLLGLSLSFIFIGCLSAVISPLEGLALLAVAAGVVIGGVILLVLANEALLRMLPRLWARIATVSLTVLLLLSWLILLTSCVGLIPF